MELLLGEGARVTAFDALGEAVELVRRTPVGVALVDLQSAPVTSFRELKASLLKHLAGLGQVFF